MLRRPHDHHRDLRAGLPAALPTIDDNRSPSGSIPHDRDYWIATAPRRSRLLLVRNRLRVRWPKITGHHRNRPPTTARNVHRHHQTELLLPTSHLIARDQTHRAPPHAPSRVSKIPIAGARPLCAPSPAGSFFGGFRTRAACTWLHRSWPASETLRTSGHPLGIN